MRLLGFAVLASTIAVTAIALTAPPQPELDSHHPRAEDIEATERLQQLNNASFVALAESNAMLGRLQHAAVLHLAHQEATRAAAVARRTKSSRGTGRWAIPAHIVACESGGDYRAENPTSSASGAYQMIDSSFVSTRAGRESGYTHASHAPPSVQDAAAAELWDGGRGRSHWAQCL